MDGLMFTCKVYERTGVCACGFVCIVKVVAIVLGLSGSEPSLRVTHPVVHP